MSTIIISTELLKTPNIIEMLRSVVVSAGNDVQIIDPANAGMPGQSRDDFYSSRFLMGDIVVLYPSEYTDSEMSKNIQEERRALATQNIENIFRTKQILTPVIPIQISTENATDSIWFPLEIKSLGALAVSEQVFSGLNPHELSVSVNRAIEDAKGFVQERARQKAEEQRLLTSNGNKYIDETIKLLSIREKVFNRNAVACFLIGFLLLSGAVISAFYFTSDFTRSKLYPAVLISKNIWPVVAYFSFRGFAILGLLIAASRYTFIIARSAMNEALRISDRIHALRYGEFYLEVYPDKADWKELKDVFQSWNINATAGFGASVSEEFHQLDPKFLEMITSIVNVVKK